MIVEVEGLSKRYGDLVALDGVSFSVDKGELFCIVGPNGAGKTTLIETMLGLRRRDSGRVALFGVEFSDKPPISILRRIGIVLEGMNLIGNLTVEENIKLAASLWGVRPSASDVERVLEIVGLLDKFDARYDSLSAGLKKKAQIATALITEPELLILDEPEANLDPLARLEVMDALRELSRRVTIIYSTHSLEIAEEYSTRLMVLNRGRVVASGAPAELVAKYGGVWRVAVKAHTPPPGFKEGEGGYYVAEFANFRDAAKALEALEALEDISEVKIIPPRLVDAFRNLIK